jgi:DNA-binding FrmR family transcriptional regulator
MRPKIFISLNGDRPFPAIFRSMSALHNDKSRTDILNRLKRAEGQLRGIQRMIEEGEGCLAIATQMAAVRKALDSTYVRMTVCFMEQQLQTKLGDELKDREAMDDMFDEIETLLGKIR